MNFKKDLSTKNQNLLKDIEYKIRKNNIDLGEN